YVHRLEISNNELKQFAHVASHDLREPLRMITSYMGLVKKSLNDNITEQQTEFINFAIGGAKRMELLIIDLLRLAKIDANTKVEPIKLKNVMTEIGLNLDVLLKEKNAAIICDELPEITADRTQMLQLFQNIIANGIKYNESETPMVKVTCITKSNEVEIAIADNGIGIDENYHERVFQIFQRIQTTREYSGSGIGLTICKKIVDGMNGRIFIESNVGAGSTFRLVFPATILV
ncbi:MAG TPA: ATP-binding protein, partial [Chitinophagales bacterium]|nr:ATP-binding protein [Chitinophagales bacterium]